MNTTVSAPYTAIWWNSNQELYWWWPTPLALILYLAACVIFVFRVILDTLPVLRAWSIISPIRAPFCGIPLAKAVAMPLIGHASYLADRITGLRTLCIDSADKRTGLCSFFIGPTPVVSVTRLQDVKTALKITNRGPTNALVSHHWKAFMGWPVLAMMSGEQWAATRQLIARGFKMEIVEAALPGMVQCANELATTLLRQSSDDKKRHSKAIDIVPICKATTMDFIGLIAFGHNFRSVVQGTAGVYGEAFRILLEQFHHRMYLHPLHPASILYSLPTTANRRHRAARDTLRNFFQQLVAEIRAEHASATLTPSNVLHEMVLGLDAARSDPMSTLSKSFTDEALVNNLILLMFGGYDTTSTAVSLALWEIARAGNRVQDRMCAEAEEVLGSVSETSKLTLKDIRSLKYCSAVFNEALRLHPPTPLTARTLEHATAFGCSSSDSGGITLPVGTNIYIPIYQVCRSKEIWGADATEFVPERFLDPQALPRGAFIPFSAGPRNCMGFRLAPIEGTLLLATLLRRFRFEPADSLPEPCVVSQGDFLMAKNGIKIVPVPRNITGKH